MRTHKLFFMGILVVLGGITQSKGQGTYSAPASAGTGGAYNTHTGTSAGSNSTNANHNNNTSIGYFSGNANISGNDNTYLGALSGRFNTAGVFNVMLGASCGQANTASLNTFIGARCGLANTIGANNVFLGYQTGLANTEGSSNTFLGRSAGAGNATGGSNAYVGFAAGYAATGSSNSFFGHNAGWQNTGGSNNVFLGFESGKGSGSSSNSVFIGNQAGFSETVSNRLYISNDGSTFNNGSITFRPLIYGEFDNGNLTFNVSKNVNSRLVIASGQPNGSFNGTSGLRFTNLTSATNAGATNGKHLTVNSTGDVYLTNDIGSINATGTNTTIAGSGTTAAPYTINAKNIYTDDGTITTATGLRTVTMGNNNLFFNTTGSNFANGTAGSGRIYIGNTTNFPLLNSTLPNISQYRLLVEGGVLTEKVKVAVRNPATNWSDYVFANDYKLTPLKEVDAFVKANKHLPGIESAETLSKNGLDLGAMQAKQMEKIEELTLYAIEQDKKLEKQSREIEELKATVNLLLNKK
ncbi:hypothetical protein [Flavobacterium sp.]|uniref:hypothetical protein n=1 Tax=Flavobacterium sp. TaxID=239 RepID=UPI00286CBB8F|nr:hypothetical protein [Flavobacterium sp.]